MKSIQSNRLSMEMTVRDYLSQNGSITTNLPGFNNHFTSLQNGINSIHSFAEVQVTDKSGVTITKNNLRNNLIILTCEMASRLCALANNTGNITLYSEVHITESMLKKSSDNILKELCQLVYDRANSNAAALAPYGATAAIITNLLNTLNSFIAYIPKTRLCRNENTLAGKQLKQQFALVADAISKIDVLVETVRYSQPAFYSGYRTARKVLKIGKRGISLKAVVTDANNNKPIQGVHIKLTGTEADFSGKGIVERRTAEKGGIRVSNLNEGSYILTASLTGYESKEVEVFITDSEMANLSISLLRRISA